MNSESLFKGFCVHAESICYLTYFIGQARAWARKNHRQPSATYPHTTIRGGGVPKHPPARRATDGEERCCKEPVPMRGSASLFKTGGGVLFFDSSKICTYMLIRLSGEKMCWKRMSPGGLRGLQNRCGACERPGWVRFPYVSAIIKYWPVGNSDCA
jgi:hypothetical protein